MKLYRRFIANGAVWTNLVLVSKPSLAFSTRLIEAQEPVRVQALRPKLPVEAFDDGVVRRLPRSGEVKGHAADEDPKIEFIAKASRDWIVAVGAKTAYIMPGNQW